MNLRQLLAVAAAASLLVPGTALAGEGNFKIRTLEGPAESTETVPVPTTEQAKAPRPKSAKSAKSACKGLSKKHVKGTKGTPYSRCIVAAAKRREQPVVPTEPVPTTDPVEAPAV